MLTRPTDNSEMIALGKEARPFINDFPLYWISLYKGFPFIRYFLHLHQSLDAPDRQLGDDQPREGGTPTLKSDASILSHPRRPNVVTKVLTQYPIPP